jgi:hypothetical protein
VYLPPSTASASVNHRLGTGFLTIVAGTNVLGINLSFSNQIRLRLSSYGFWDWLWLLLTYAIFTAFTVKEEKPSLEEGINGAWLLFIVSTQSIPVLGMLLVSRFEAWQEMFTFAMLGFYLLGCMFYILIISLIVYRFMFFKIEAEEMNPSYWINTGAVAITTLAGANILLKGNVAFLADLAPFIKGFTIFFWAAGTWWIPYLFIVGAWQLTNVTHWPIIPLGIGLPGHVHGCH